MSQPVPDLHVLLVGVNHYNAGPADSPLQPPPNLRGCVRDIDLVEEFLKTRLGVPGARVRKLTSTAPAGAEDGRRRCPPVEPEADRPTYRNLVAAFKAVTGTAAPGDLVYVHYSGHGARAATLWPNHKAPERWDEGLVPCDIADPQAQYLRDLELAYLLKRMVDKGLVVTVVLDCCHSGGATRDARADEAGVREAPADPTARPFQPLVAPLDELAAGFQRPAADRSARPTGGLSPGGNDFVLIAGCRAHESAYEFPFDGGPEKNGAVTYWLLDAVRGLRPGLSYQDVYDRVLTKVHAQFDRQTPVLLGPADRKFLGTDKVPVRPPAARVESVDAANGRVVLQTGQAVGVRAGARFALYPQAAKAEAPPAAVVEVDRLGAAASGAKVVDGKLDGVQAGDPAVLLGSTGLRRAVRVGVPGDLPGGPLDAVRESFPRPDAGWVELAADGEPAAFAVSIADGRFVMGDAGFARDEAGRPLANLPAVPATDAEAPRVVALLEHLARFRAAQEIENHNARSPLAGKLEVRLLGRREAGYDPGEAPNPKPFPPGVLPEVAEGEWVFVHVRNTSGQALNVSALDLQPDWGVTLVHPWTGDLSFETVEAGGERTISLHCFLPQWVDAGTDLIKVFGSVGPADYRALTLAAIDPTAGWGATKGGATRSAAEKAAGRGGGAATELDRLFDALTADRPTKNTAPKPTPSAEWTTAGVTFRVRRGAAGATGSPPAGRCG